MFQWLLRPAIAFVIGTGATLIPQDLQDFPNLKPPTEMQVEFEERIAPATVFSSGNLILALPDNTTTTSTLGVANAGAVVDVNLRLRIDHARLQDLDIHLIGPDGTTVEIATDVGQSNADFGAGNANCTGLFAQFDDDGTTSVLAGAAPFLGVHRPESSLAQFKGRPAGGTWTLRIADDSVAPAGTLYCWQLVLRRAAVPADFAGNSKSELAVFRPSTLGVVTREIENSFTVTYFASGIQGTDIPVHGDYDGNGSDDVSFFRPSTGEWRGFSISPAVPWGGPGDVPVPGDYNADGATDIAVWRPSTGVWFVRNQFSVPWGGSGDIPVPGDYNGDGATDLAVWRPSSGIWFVNGVTSVGWGGSGDIPVPADYDGDARTDFGVFRPTTGQWFIFTAAGVVLPVTNWGGNGDIPVPTDFDGDFKAELAVWRPSDQTYYIRNVGVLQFGLAGDIPAQKRPAYPGYPY